MKFRKVKGRDRWVSACGRYVIVKSARLLTPYLAKLINDGYVWGGHAIGSASSLDGAKEVVARHAERGMGK